MNGTTSLFARIIEEGRSGEGDGKGKGEAACVSHSFYSTGPCIQFKNKPCVKFSSTSIICLRNRFKRN